MIRFSAVGGSQSDIAPPARPKLVFNPKGVKAFHDGAGGSYGPGTGGAHIGTDHFP
jgi:hypothetical protein